jgi:hypothetical protein
MQRFLALSIVVATVILAAAADRKWQTGIWADITTKRRIVDFGPGASGFGRPGTTPQMQAMADVHRFIIETDQARIEIEDTVPVGRRSFDATIGAMVTFAVEKNSVYVRDSGGTEHKLRLIKKTDRAKAEPPGQKPGYTALGGGHVVRSVTDRGQYVTLEDGSRWEVAARDQYQTDASGARFGLPARDVPEERKLLLLQLQQLRPFLIADLIQLDVKRENLHLRFDVDLVVVFGVDSIVSGLPVLAHHDDGRLQRGRARQHEVEQNVRVRIERLRHHHIGQQPDADAPEREENERPAAAEGRHAIGDAITEGDWLRGDIARHTLAVNEAIDDVTLDFIQPRDLVEQRMRMRVGHLNPPEMKG